MDQIRLDGGTPSFPSIAGDQFVLQRVLDRINGETIEAGLRELAAIGGAALEPTALHPEHVSTNRIALSEEDELARQTFIRPRMEAAGMEVYDEHPLAMIGIYRGKNPDLAPVAVLSHTDTVPDGDIYDGTLGVLGGIEAVAALHAEGVRPERDIMVISLTGEESSGFNFALFGSKALFHGLTDKDLEARIEGGLSIRESLPPQAVEAVKVPLFGDENGQLPLPYSVLELHVEQDTKLEAAGIDVGVVESIAAPERYQVNIGDTALPPDAKVYPVERYLRLDVRGKADHSGATPMGLARADGLVETSSILKPLLDEIPAELFSIGQIAVDGGAMNKVPGLTQSYIRLTGETDQELERVLMRITDLLSERRKQHFELETRFQQDPYELRLINKQDAGTFFDPEAIRSRHHTAFETILAVNEAANLNSLYKVVGTVGTHTISDDGRISLKLDVRGISEESRAAAIAQIKHDAAAAATDTIDFGEPLPGSGSPVMLDSRLVNMATDTIELFEIGSAQQLFSAAGHDAQNAARRSIPTGMLFVQSNNTGLAHHPDAYTAPQHLQSGVRALAALATRLAQEVPA